MLKLREARRVKRMLHIQVFIRYTSDWHISYDSTCHVINTLNDQYLRAVCH